ncbi:GAF domain-containing sensor histidine kinase [Nocardioides sp. GY 10113]|uniref:sensor histidine kinase n=1 Tax=Nocardioides sp. GY 10113 TaxID=2569761 RepID=UPI0010A8AC0D|nr:GAF domain-containing sensor histidine kinase [Nocardioides sp. GY 10113]TIC85886.1 GAF domain-containing sensor histidine kinase [Nocardioides sp. GY 10113]
MRTDGRTGEAAGSPAAALLLPALCVALVPLAAWLDAGAPATGPGAEIAGGPGWPWTLIGALLGTLAGVVLARDRRQVFGWVLAGFGLFWALDGLAQSYVHAGLTATGSWPGMTFALWFLNRFGAYLTVITAILLMVFPTGRFLPGRWRTWCRAVVALVAVAGLTFLVVPSADRVPADLPPDVDPDPTTIDALAGLVDPLVALAQAALVGTLLFALVTVVVRYRRTSGAARDQMRWLAWSAVVLLVAVPAGLVVRLPGTDYVVLLLVTVLPPAAMTVAIVRPSLVPIQDLLGRTIVLAVVLAALAAADVAVLAALTVALDDALTQAQVVAVVLVVAVLLYGPLRSRLSAAVRRLMLGERGSRYDAVAGLAATLEATDDPEEQLAAAARAVAAAFGVRFVSLEVGGGGVGTRRVTSHGTRPAAVRSLPITYRGRQVGVLVLPARGLRSRLTARDEALVGDLVRQAVAAARTSRLAEEVQESRERLVTAREEERRRIRRDLHDGLGPALGGVVFQLESARLLVDRDPDAATAQIEAVTGHVQEVVADVRRLVHDLRPPALDDRGLVGALRQQADLLDPPATVEAGALGPLPAAVEVAAYRIAGEAMTNAARHAGATACAVRLAVADGHLLLEVADNGIGIADGTPAGVGLVGLRERADELGGRSEVACPPGGGTVVRAWLPLRQEGNDD